MDFKWITAPADVGEAACRFCREITVSKKISKAALHATAIGVYAPYLNGVRLDAAYSLPDGPLITNEFNITATT